ncbi:MAG: type II toxin-antitoxin system VapC family toxin [Ignavibacteriaceae bacterium]|nr:type II toxin-antitoxin system VapC family toxin [Ignavibacteriaceae bacterium]
MVLCDTNIIIELLKGNVKVINVIEKIGLDNIGISAITEMELYFGAFNKSELKFITKHLHGIPSYHIHNDISIMAVTLTEQYSKSHKLSIPDALIAATAIINNFELFTLNIKDFKYIPNIKLYKKLQ